MVNPETFITKRITEITGITSEMIKTAPYIDSVMPEFLKFIGDSVLVGHNIASFDIRFIETELQELVDNKLIDTLRIAKIMMPEMENYRLTTIADRLGIEYSTSHRALSDVYITKEVFEKIRVMGADDIDMLEISNPIREINPKSFWQANYTDDTLALQELKDLLEEVIKDNVIDISEVYLIHKWVERNENLRGNYPFDKVFDALDKVLDDGIIEDNEREMLLNVFNTLVDPVANASHEKIGSLEGKHCVLTGDFLEGTKADVESYIIAKGGIIDKSVKKATDLVIVGGKGSAAWKQGNYGGKIKKAMEFNDKYAEVNIQLIAEDDFFSEV